jgi:hypothetical protein
LWATLTLTRLRLALRMLCDATPVAMGAPLRLAVLRCTAHAGMAKDAKVFFQDIGVTGGGLNVPDDIESDIFTPVYQFDPEARIHSNSWGANTNTYTSNSQSVDSMMFKNQDMLILFAAGNDGQKAGSISGSVGAPATAKNALVVGASQTTREGFADSFIYTPWDKKRQEAAEQLDEPNLNCCADSRRGVQQFCCESFNRQSLNEHPDVRAAATQLWRLVCSA